MGGCVQGSGGASAAAGHCRCRCCRRRPRLKESVRVLLQTLSIQSPPKSFTRQGLGRARKPRPFRFRAAAAVDAPPASPVAVARSDQRVEEGAPAPAGAGPVY